MSQNQPHTPPPAAEEPKRGKKKWLVLLLLLLLLAITSSSVVGYILGKNAGTRPLGQLLDTILLTPDQNDPTDPQPQPTEPDASTQPDQTEPTGEETEPSGGGQGSAGRDDGKLSVSGQTPGGQYVSWTQLSTIDLFYNRTAGVQAEIAPGSAGYYRFQLKNTRARALTLNLTLSEGKQLHLPLQFTLTPLNAKGEKQTALAVKGAFRDGSATLELATGIDGKDTVTYQLDWVWPFESGDDPADTRLGEAGGLYTLYLNIYAEEV